MICLNSTIELTTRAMTIFLHVGISTPVVSSCEVLLKFAQIAPANRAFFGGDPANIVRVLFYEVVVQVVQCAPHLIRMLLIDAKHDRLGEAICLFKKVSKIPSDSFSPSFKGDGSLKIHCLILGIRYVAPVRSRSPLLGRQPAASHSVMMRCTR